MTVTVANSLVRKGQLVPTIRRLERLGIKVLAELKRVKWEGESERERLRCHHQRTRRKEEKALREMESRSLLALGRRSVWSKSERVLRPRVQLPGPQSRVPRRDD
jgi:hypothetical protein